MKFKIRVRNIGQTDEGWWEEYDKPVNDAERKAKEIIEFFNDTLRPGEPARELLEVVMLDASKATAAHSWHKTNLVSIRTAGGGIHDTYRCTNCGITGKRYGLSPGVTIDSKYKAKVYTDCAKTKEHLSHKSGRAHV
jgi:hypothetical protein